jgi:hypothetical protein
LGRGTDHTGTVFDTSAAGRYGKQSNQQTETATDHVTTSIPHSHMASDTRVNFPPLVAWTPIALPLRKSGETVRG